MRSLSEARNVAEFQSFGKEAEEICSLFLESASFRQLARVAGLSRGLITRVCQK